MTPSRYEDAEAAVTTSPNDPGHNAVTRYVHSYTGRRIEGPGGEGAPVLVDIAVQTGRQPRFAGATTRFWSVLLHLFVTRLVTKELLLGDLDAQLYALMHDDHEGTLGDQPSPFKLPEYSSFCEEVSGRIRTEYRIPGPSSEAVEIVKYADRLALLAEARTLTPNHEWALTDDPDEEDLVQGTMILVADVMAEYPDYEDVLEEGGRAVQDWIMLASAMIEAVTGEAVS